ncbi:hypothetical protein MLD38_037627 [Melastoma candidum]|uniref:Uncharacterized protein n=1 Tax=Melastoma candidum TaxID=119954 RepID=A0ACB9LPF1_9MYRT|nr:hypothetical protein MLD38_037627 [Melastoma candidum]
MNIATLCTVITVTVFAFASPGAAADVDPQTVFMVCNKTNFPDDSFFANRRSLVGRELGFPFSLCESTDEGTGQLPPVSPLRLGLSATVASVAESRTAKPRKRKRRAGTVDAEEEGSPRLEGLATAHVAGIRNEMHVASFMWNWSEEESTVDSAKALSNCRDSLMKSLSSRLELNQHQDCWLSRGGHRWWLHGGADPP